MNDQAPSSPPLLKPTLYGRDADGAPVLLGGRCECGHLFFPMQTFGCERCGKNGDALQPTTLRGAGRLLASAAVHVHEAPGRQAPFVVGAVALDDGPVVRALLTKAPLRLDDRPVRVRAALVRVTVEPDAAALDLRFEPLPPGVG